MPEDVTGHFKYSSAPEKKCYAKELFSKWYNYDFFLFGNLNFKTI